MKHGRWLIVANIHVQNWRDERGTDLEKAQAVITDRNTKLTETSKLLDIPLRTLKEYRAHPEKLKVASWERVAKLAHLNDANYIMDNMSADDTKEFMKYLDELFKKIVGSGDETDLAVIDRMKHIIMTDPLAVVELYKAYCDQLDDDTNSWFWYNTYKLSGLKSNGISYLGCR